VLPVGNAATFALTALALIVIPGPSVLFVIGRSLALGRRGGLVSVLGNALGTLPAVAAVSFGLGQVIADSLIVFLVIKIVGALYLAYLGVQAIRHRHDHAASVDSAPVQPPSTLRLLREGIVVGASNPKTVVFFVAVLPQFVNRHSGAGSLQLALLGSIFIVIALASDSTWAVVAGTARAWFGRSPRRLSRMTAGGGVMMIGLGGVLVATGNKR
jgi:threonine/homoserine/homoserine lactone efflux protein